MKVIPEIKELTSIRFFAAFHILFFHNFFLAGDDLKNVPEWILSFISHGDSAVTFFFVLSGFILTYVYSGPDFSLRTSKKRFYLARLSRIYPIYLVAFFMDVPKSITYFIEKYDFTTSLQKIFISASAHLTMTQSWHPRLTAAWNSPAWSISTEMFFYMMAPFVIPFVLKLRKNLLPVIILYLIPITIYFSLSTLTNFKFEQEGASIFWRSFPILRLTDFAIGVFVGKVFLQEGEVVTWLRKNKGVNSGLFWVSFFLSLLVTSANFKFPRLIFANVFLIPLFALMILSIATTRVSYTGFLRMKPILLLGGASYALYMIHEPMIFYVGHIFRSLSIGYSLVYFVTYLTLSILTSIILYKILELPAQKWIRAKF